MFPGSGQFGGAVASVVVADIEGRFHSSGIAGFGEVRGGIEPGVVDAPCAVTQVVVGVIVELYREVPVAEHLFLCQLVARLLVEEAAEHVFTRTERGGGNTGTQKAV